jgi:hypothetical protein
LRFIDRTLNDSGDSKRRCRNKSREKCLPRVLTRLPAKAVVTTVQPRVVTMTAAGLDKLAGWLAG